MADSLTNLLDEHIQNVHKDDEDRTTHLHITDLSSCPSGVFLKKRGLKTSLSPAKLRRFEVGHIIEDFILDGVMASGEYELLPENKQQLIWPDLNLVGTPDIVALHKPTNTPWLIEIKSIHPFALDKMKGIHPHYREQVNMYFSQLRMRYPNMKAKIMYFSLDGRTQEYEVEYNEFIVERCIKKAALLRDALATGRKPAPAPDIVMEGGKRKKNWVADYCMRDEVHQYCLNDPELTYNKWVYRTKKKL